MKITDKIRIKSLIINGISLHDDTIISVEGPDKEGGYWVIKYQDGTVLWIVGDGLFEFKEVQREAYEL